MEQSAEHRLWQSSMDGDVETVRSLLAPGSAVDVNLVLGDRLDTPLHRACRFGRTAVAKALLGDPRVEVNKLNIFGCTPFFISCQEGSTDIVEMLLADPRVDVTWPHKEGHEPFFMACQEGCQDVVRLLLADPRIDVNKVTPKGATPFFIACWKGTIEIVRMLLRDHRVDVTRPMKDGCTPFYVACAQNGSSRDLVELLLADPRTDPAIPSAEKTSPFLVACEGGDAEVIGVLLSEPRIDVNLPTATGHSPLWFASQNGYLPVVQFLLSSDREVDTGMKSQTHEKKTAAEQARWAAGQHDRWAHIVRDDPDRRSRYCPLIVELITAYESGPAEVRLRLRREPGVRGFSPPSSPFRLLPRQANLLLPFVLLLEHYAGLAFALVVFLTDGFVEPTRDIPENLRRFFKIASDLPLEMQVVLCNRLFGSSRDIIPWRYSETGFKWLARPSTWKHPINK